MRVLHISTDFKPVGSRVGYGGVERLVGWLGDQQRTSGHDIFIGTVEGSDYPNAIPVFRSDLHLIKQTEPARYRALILEAFRDLVSQARRLNIDLIHDHMGIFTVHLSKTSPVSWPIVVSVYAQPRHYAYADVLPAISHARVELPWLVVTASSIAHQRELEATIATDFVVHTAVPEHELATGSDRLAYLCLAGVRPDKMQVELARLAVDAGLPFIFAGPLLCPDNVHQEYASQFLGTVGAQIDLEQYTDEQAQIVLGDAVRQHSVVFVSEVFRDSLKDLLFSQCEKLVLLNKTEEAFSLVVLEALARGVTVVCGPFTSAFESLQGFGYVVRDLSRQEILRALYARRFAPSSIQAFSRARFSLQNYAGVLDAVYIEAAHRFRER